MSAAKNAGTEAGPSGVPAPALGLGVSSVAEPERIYDLGTERATPGWRTLGPPRTGHPLAIDAAERAAERLAGALTDEQLTPADRAQLLAELAEVLEPAGLSLTDPNAPAGRPPRERAHAAAVELVAAVTAPQPTGEHTAKVWGATVTVLRRHGFTIRRR